MAEAFIQKVRFDERGLIAAVVQDASTSEIVALTQMDNATLMKTLQTGQTDFLSTLKSVPEKRSYRLLDVRVNADGESLTVLVERVSNEAGEEKPVSLLRDFREAQKTTAGEVSLFDAGSIEFGLAINNLYALIAERKQQRPEGSYTTYLFNSGIDKILKKIAEESGEVIIASKNKSPRELIAELADLFYHLLVLMVERDIKLSDVHEELSRRAAPQK
ncbi:MAG TPA: phosphoribosyl-ATP diphosphatase [Blastocatellia bacterium]|nr:phosphoribosyl-ATP diphosphatase [Blastocatellia bacterium]